MRAIDVTEIPTEDGPIQRRFTVSDCETADEAMNAPHVPKMHDPYDETMLEWRASRVSAKPAIDTPDTFDITVTYSHPTEDISEISEEGNAA